METEQFAASLQCFMFPMWRVVCGYPLCWISTGHIFHAHARTFPGPKFLSVFKI